MPGPVVIALRRHFPHALPAAYAWLTDFQDDDTARAGAVVRSRRVKERGDKRVVYEGHQRVLGRETWGTTEVLLAPPDRWEARVIEGPRTGSRTEYHLVPTAHGTSLSVTYHLVLQDPTKHTLLRLLRPLVRRELSRMWDGFQAAMAKDLAPR